MEINQYLREVEAKVRRPDNTFPKKWSLFLARYRLLIEFSGIEFHSLRGSTAKGYSSALKLGLAYTALEAFWNARGNRNGTPIRDNSAARLLRGLRGSKFERYLVESAKRKALKERLEAMFASQSNMDITPLIEAVRHSVFHGSFTPFGSGFTTDANVRLLFDLACELAIDEISRELESFLAE